MSEFDTLLRFDSMDDLLAALPCEEEPRPPSWRVGDRSMLAPVTITPPVIGYTHTHEGYMDDIQTPIYAYDAAEAILPGVYAVVTTKGLDEALWEDFPAIAMRDRETGAVIRQRTTNPVDLPMCVSPVWAGMPGTFVLPAVQV